MMPEHPASVTLLLVDDRTITRLVLRAAFERTEGIRVIAEAGSVNEAVDAASRFSPNVVLIDMRMPNGAAIDACREILALYPETRVLLLTSYDDGAALYLALSDRTRGFLVKEIDGDPLLAAVRAIAAGESVVDAATTRAIAETMQNLASSGAAGHATEPLSYQQKRVLALVAEGKTNKEIATAIGLSDKTVKNYLSSIFRKLNVSRRAHAAAIYHRRNPE